MSIPQRPTGNFRFHMQLLKARQEARARSSQLKPVHKVSLGVLPLSYLLSTCYVKVDQKWRRRH